MSKWTCHILTSIWTLRQPCLNVIFCTLKKINVIEHVVIELMCAFTLLMQKSMFKMTMKSNAKVALVLPS
jgi:hypothetical protein